MQRSSLASASPHHYGPEQDGHQPDPLGSMRAPLIGFLVLAAIILASGFGALGAGGL